MFAVIFPKEGLDLYLTIDETIQFIVERELSRAMIEMSLREQWE